MELNNPKIIMFRLLKGFLLVILFAFAFVSIYYHYNAYVMTETTESLQWIHRKMETLLLMSITTEEEVSTFCCFPSRFPLPN